jgi:hypothetical protein
MSPLKFERKEEQMTDAKLPIEDEALSVTELTCEHQVHEKLSLKNKSLENKEEVCEANERDDGYGESEIEEELSEEENTMDDVNELFPVKWLEEKIFEKVLVHEKREGNLKEKSEEEKSKEGKMASREIQLRSSARK